MLGLALALALAAAGDPAAEGLRTRLPPAPLSLYHIAWQRPFVGVLPFEVEPLEEGGVAVDPVTGLALCGTRDGWLHAMRSDGTLAWEFKAANGFAAPPLVDGDTAYVAAGDSRVYALALSDGKLRWKYAAKSELVSRPVLSGGVLYVVTVEDTLVAIDAKRGEHLWHYERPSRSIDRDYTIRGMATPVVAGGAIYAAFSDGFVVSLDVTASGQVRWESQLAPSGDYMDVDGLAVEGGRLYAAAYSGAVVAASTSTGLVEWTYRAPAVTRVVAGRGQLVAVTATQLLGLSDAGALLWSTPLEGSPGQAPVLAGRWVLVPAGPSGLRFVEPASGRVLRTFNPGSGVTGQPALRGQRAYVLSNQGVLYALDVQ